MGPHGQDAPTLSSGRRAMNTVPSRTTTAPTTRISSLGVPLAEEEEARSEKHLLCWEQRHERVWRAVMGGR